METLEFLSEVKKLRFDRNEGKGVKIFFKFLKCTSLAMFIFAIFTFSMKALLFSGATAFLLAGLMISQAVKKVDRMSGLTGHLKSLGLSLRESAKAISRISVNDIEMLEKAEVSNNARDRLLEIAARALAYDSLKERTQALRRMRNIVENAKIDGWGKFEVDIRLKS
jgi:hypothetical protein